MFTTKVIPEISENKISLSDKMIATGSCFAQNIGQKLLDYKFDITVNPFGTIFNPISIFKLVNLAAREEIIASMGIVKNQGIFHHYDLHSDLSNVNEKELLQNADDILQKLGEELKNTAVVIYTFGTSIVYELRETGEIVANCHKVPANEFTRRFLEVDEIVHAFKVNYELIKSINKKTRFILTVSPVRHQKESFQQNNVSKSILRIACEKIVNEYSSVEYFPAFEIVMDELRDYRFYAEDLLHPNKIATNYIWQKFQYTFFDEKQRQFVLKWEKVRKALTHKPFNVNSEQHQLFIKKTIQMLYEFKEEVDITPELDLLKAQLI